MTLIELLERKRRELNTKIALRNQYATELAALQLQTAADPAKVTELRGHQATLDAEIPDIQDDVTTYERALAEDEELTRQQQQRGNVGAGYVPRDHDINAETGDIVAAAAVSSKRDKWINLDNGQRADLDPARGFRALAGAGDGTDRHVVAQFGGFGGMVRAMTTSGSSAVVPTLWAADIIDRARNYSQVLNAGATIIPMPSGTLQIGRLTGDPTAAFRAEGSTIAASDATLDNVTLTAKTLSALVITSEELLQDADNVDELLKDAIAKSMALKIDQVCLYGGQSAPVDLSAAAIPTGLLTELTAQLSANVLGNATNGTAQTTGTYYAELLALYYQVLRGNEQPNAFIWNAQADQQYAGANDTTGQPLRFPPAIESVPRLVSNQILSYTKGAMTSRATDVFAGDFTKLLIGQRLEIKLQVLEERWADNGQVGFKASWRGDIAIARATAFAVYKALQGAL